MAKRISLLLLLSFVLIAEVFSTQHKTNLTTEPQYNNESIQLFEKFELGITAGTTGIGFDLSTPINEYLQIRAGYTFIPKFKLSMAFDAGIEEDMYISDNEGNHILDEEGNPTFTEFGKIINIVESVTGNAIQNEIVMQAEPSIHNFKFLVDLHPFKNKRWFFTGGFYLGSSTIGRVYNSTESMPTLYAANMFNRMYDKASQGTEDDPVPIISLFGFDFYAGPALLEYDRIGLNVGQRTDDGTTYKMTPNEHCMVGVDAKVNSFKPYLGFGYGTSALSGNRKTNFAFDCGFLFWGGAPDIITHDGTNLTKDITNIEGQMGKYIGLAKKFTAYPIINFRISRTIF